MTNKVLGLTETTHQRFLDAASEITMAPIQVVRAPVSAPAAPRPK